MSTPALDQSVSSEQNQHKVLCKRLLGNHFVPTSGWAGAESLCPELLLFRALQRLCAGRNKDARMTLSSRAGL